MFFINKHKEADEEIIYKLRKKKKSLIFGLVVTPFWFAICFVILVPCFKNWFLGEVSFDSDGSYMVSIFLMFTFVPFMTIPLLNYVTNTLIITNKRVFIRKAISGCLLIIDLKCIKSYKYLEFNDRGFKSHYIQFLIDNNKYYKTGNLFIKKESLTELTKVLNRTIKQEKPNKKDKLILKEPVNCSAKVFRNFIFSAIYFAPFFIAILMSILLISGFNHRVGMQTNIEVSGIIEKKSASHNAKSNSTSYNVILKEKSNGKEYDIMVEEKIFNMFNEGDNALVQAKKGSLGIVYDTVFYKK